MGMRRSRRNSAPPLSLVEDVEEESLHNMLSASELIVTIPSSKARFESGKAEFLCSSNLKGSNSPSGSSPCGSETSELLFCSECPKDANRSPQVSAGSVGHEMGLCKPCTWFWR